jgi:hypothetical protein
MLFDQGFSSFELGHSIGEIDSQLINLMAGHGQHPQKWPT